MENPATVGMTKKEHEKIWQLNKNVTINLHKWTIAEENAERRRKNASFRYFGHGQPLGRDIGQQHSSRYRSGKNHRREGYEMLKRRAGGDARVKRALLLKGTCPVTMKEFGVQGPLPKR